MSIVRAASQQAQLVHNAQVQAVQTEEVSADELWSFVVKNSRNAFQTTKSLRLLDWSEFSRFEWTDPSRPCWQTHR